MEGFGGRAKVGFEEGSVGSRFGFWGSGLGSEGGEGGNSKSKSSSSKVELLASSHSSSCGSGASISFAAVYVAGLLCDCVFLDSGMTRPKESKRKMEGFCFGGNGSSKVPYYPSSIKCKQINQKCHSPMLPILWKNSTEKEEELDGENSLIN